MLNDNPFSSIIQNIREDGKNQIPAHYRLGTVISTIPLIIDVAGTRQDKESLLCNSNIGALEASNRVLLIPIEDEQRYILMCKVVNV